MPIAAKAFCIVNFLTKPIFTGNIWRLGDDGFTKIFTVFQKKTTLVKKNSKPDWVNNLL